MKQIWIGGVSNFWVIIEIIYGVGCITWGVVVGFSLLLMEQID
jgi:hypothetical protein